MTAKLKHGTHHRGTLGADHGTPHERLNRLHAQPGRPEGAMHPRESEPPPSPVPAAPPMGISGPGPAMGAGAEDDEAGEQT